MRIISGTHKGRVIHAPHNLPVRPTTDFAKESLFNILNNYFDFEGLEIADLFCGTGNITYEFASRGCADIVAVDSHYKCCVFVKKTISELKFTGVKVIKQDVFSFLKNTNDTFSLIFADPPYEMNNIHEIVSLVFEKKLVKENGWLIVEHGEQTDLSQLQYFKEKRKYGNVNFSIFVNT